MTVATKKVMQNRAEKGHFACQARLEETTQFYQAVADLWEQGERSLRLGGLEDDLKEVAAAAAAPVHQRFPVLLAGLYS